MGSGRRRDRSANRRLAEGWSDTLRVYGERLEGLLLHDALAELWEFVGRANKVVDAEKPWELAKAAKDGRRGGRRATPRRAGGPAGGVPADRPGRGPVHARHVAPRVLGQLGYAYDYGADGNGGPPILDQLAWGARAGEPGRVTAPEPLFPRLDVEAETPLSARAADRSR